MQSNFVDYNCVHTSPALLSQCALVLCQWHNQRDKRDVIVCGVLLHQGLEREPVHRPDHPACGRFGKKNDRAWSENTGCFQVNLLIQK